MKPFTPVILTLITALTAATVTRAADAPPAARNTDHARVMVYRDKEGAEHPVRNVADWQRRRRDILDGMQEAMGPLPDHANLPPLDVRVIDTQRGSNYTRQTITFVPEAGDRLTAYLYIPDPRSDADATKPVRHPAMLALHPTHPIGKGVVDGQSDRPNRAYGKELAERGYVVIAPDYPSFGDAKDYDFRKAFDSGRYASGTMKGIFNHMRCVDLLAARDDVDPERIGVIGHSLGGHNAMFVGVFDTRLKVIVSSCGWTPFHDYYGGKLAGWTSDRYMPRLRDVYQLDADRVPFDFYEVLAALAPRAFFSNSPLHDDNFDVAGVRKAIPVAREVYALYGAADRVQLETPDATHDFPQDVRERAYAFIDAALKSPLKTANAAQPVNGVAFTAARGHWAFEPVRKIEPPAASGAVASDHSIDRFVNAKLAQEKLTPTDRADKRALIRRATFDLIGLPPTPDEVEAFVNDNSPDAFNKVIDRLLASPHYGERWGRHWLDVVRYADTAGETADFPVPQAWRYRNYVIDAFNKDKPYEQFLREQIAGDILASQLPGDAPPHRYAELVTATGYIAIARRFGFDIEKDHYLTIDDTLDTLGKSVLGLAIGCARCHDHKYDPISVSDYYALYGIFESTRYPFSGCEKTKTQRDLQPLLSAAEWQSTVTPYEQKLAAIDAKIKQLDTRENDLATQWKDLSAKAARTLGEGAIDRASEERFETGREALGSVTVKQGEVIQLSIAPRANHGADSTLVEFEIAEVGGMGRKWKVTRDLMGDLLAGNPHADGLGHASTWSLFDLRDGARLLNDPQRDFSGQRGLNIWRRGDTPSAWVTAADQPIKAWTTLPPRTFFMHPGPQGPVGLAWLSPIDGAVSITGRVADAHPEGGDGIAWKIEHFGVPFADAIGSFVSLTKDGKTLRDERAAHVAAAPPRELAYAVSEGEAHDAQIQLRGDPESRGAAVPRRFMTMFGGQQVTQRATSGRLELANWLASPDNPLTARVMVNRIWQHHFGAGLVATPNNFGTRGEPPTHPELLDYLARSFIDSGWSVKAMHRLIMTSQAYQRSSTAGDAHRAAAERDPSNQLLWRFNRRRLSAEEIRDSILTASGRLDPTPGEGHPFPAQGSWGFTQHTPFTAVYDSNRRSVYLMTQRIKRHPYLALFDGPDAASSTEQRITTTVPTQALFFMNNPFVHEQASHMAARLASIADDAARLDAAYRLLYARPPTDEERSLAATFMSDYAGGKADAQRKTAWAAWLRILMSSNEFVYVD